MRKQISLLVIAVIGVVGIIGCEPQDTTIKALALSTTSIVQNLKQKEDNVLSILSNNLHKVEALYKRVREAGAPSVAYDEFVKELKDIVEVFEKTANNESSIKRDIRNKFKALNRVISMSQTKIDELKEQKATTRLELASLNGSKEKLAEAKSKGLVFITNAIDQQIIIWGNFQPHLRAIASEASGVEDRIEEILEVIDLNARVFREGLNLVEAQHDIRQIQELLSQLPDIERLTAEMIASWDTLDYLLGVMDDYKTQVSPGLTDRS